MSLPTLQELWDSHTGRLADKWAHYLPVYDRYFAKFRGTPCRILEIGVAHGGSLQLWKAYFGPKAHVWGLDIDPRCREYIEEGLNIIIRDQADPAIAEYWEKDGALDIVIDDGSHKLTDQQASLDALWPKLNPGGVYLIEDCHLHFPHYPTYPGVSEGHGIGRPKSLLAGLHYYPWVVVFEKGYTEPKRIVTGSPSRPLNADERAAYGAINPRYAQ